MTSTRERAERLAALLEDDAVPVGEGDDVVFDAPWQARLFGLAMALHESSDEYEWADFQAQLVESIASADARALQEDTESVYYERWLSTLEAFLIEEDLVSTAEIEARTEAFSDGERDASEFVVGDVDH
ncbi:MAG: nitrile hydratase accessory protein [Salinigranum sp.]